MKQTLQLRLGQQLTMTPQMQQAIRLLQTPAIELKAEIQEALESNMMLELEEDDGAPAEDEAPADEAIDEAAPEEDWDEPTLDWSSTPTAAAGPVPDEWQTAAPTSLRDYLLWQLDLTPFSPADACIAEVLIDCIDDDGYLHTDLDGIRTALPDGVDAGDDDIEAVLHRIQRFDPVGVGARSVAECLSVQLGQLGDGPVVELATRIVEGHLDDLAEGRSAALARAFEVDEDSVAEAAELIRSLNPRPGAGVSPPESDHIIPDVLVRKRGGEWVVELNPELLPRLRINPYYAELADNRSDEQERACLKQHLQEARWLLRSLRTRAETLLQVASFVVKHQRDWLEQGDTAMRPLVLRNVAEALEMHESTVSRATAGKYLLTPRGVVDFRRFFSNELMGGGGASATAVRAQIKRMIAAEEPDRPLSDGRIAVLLSEMGLQVARRTVAKYRESMSIPATPERRAMRQTP